MSMEKYGVSDKKKLQEDELKFIKSHLKEKRASLEKTAAQTQEIEQLELRESELTLELQADR